MLLNASGNVRVTPLLPVVFPPCSIHPSLYLRYQLLALYQNNEYASQPSARISKATPRGFLVVAINCLQIVVNSNLNKIKGLTLNPVEFYRIRFERFPGTGLPSAELVVKSRTFFSDSSQGLNGDPHLGSNFPKSYCGTRAMRSASLYHSSKTSSFTSQPPCRKQ
nr:MAG TPA: hypothetical protein [Caudoviricetes sp.]